MLRKEKLSNTDTQAMSGIVSAAIKSCMEARAETAQDVTTICLSASLPGVTTMAQLVGKDHAVTTESILFSCLVMARAVQVDSVEDHADDATGFAGCMMQNNPVMVSEAMNDVRKLIGKEPAEYLHPPFVAAIEAGLKLPRPLAKLLPFAGRRDIN